MGGERAKCEPNRRVPLCDSLNPNLNLNLNLNLFLATENRQQISRIKFSLEIEILYLSKRATCLFFFTHFLTSFSLVTQCFFGKKERRERKKQEKKERKKLRSGSFVKFVWRNYCDWLVLATTNSQPLLQLRDTKRDKLAAERKTTQLLVTFSSGHANTPPPSPPPSIIIILLLPLLLFSSPVLNFFSTCPKLKTPRAKLSYYAFRALN